MSHYGTSPESAQDGVASLGGLDAIIGQDDFLRFLIQERGGSDPNKQVDPSRAAELAFAIGSPVLQGNADRALLERQLAAGTEVHRVSVRYSLRGDDPGHFDRHTAFLTRIAALQQRLETPRPKGF